MGCFDEINIKITGQVKPVGLGKCVISRLRTLAAEYDLELEEQ